MPVQMVDEGKIFPTDTATDEEKALVLQGAVDMFKEATDHNLAFFLGVFKKDTDGTPGIVLTGRGSTGEMRMMAESLVDKARRTGPDGFLNRLKDIFGTDSVFVVEDGSELENLSLDAAMKSLIENELVAEGIALPRREDAVEEMPFDHDEASKKKHPDEA